MGKESDAMMEYLKDNERFADLFNGSYFLGNPVIKAEELQEGSEVYREAAGGKSTTRTRDVKKYLKSGGSLKVLAIENQNLTDYTMPWRHMNYDVLEYGRQIKEIKKKNKDNKKLHIPAERLSGLTEKDRLVPTFTLCLYHGEDKWHGPRSLKDMIDFGEDGELWKQLFSDYQMKLICLNEMDDFSQFHSSLKQLFQLLAFRRDKKKLKQLLEEDASYQDMDEETADVVSTLMGVEKEMAKKDNGEEGYNMCTAIKEMLEDSRLEGRQEGRWEERGEIVRNMLNNGLTCEKVAELTGIALAVVKDMQNKPSNCE